MRSTRSSFISQVGAGIACAPVSPSKNVTFDVTSLDAMFTVDKFKVGAIYHDGRGPVLTIIDANAIARTVRIPLLPLHEPVSGWMSHFEAVNAGSSPPLLAAVNADMYVPRTSYMNAPGINMAGNILVGVSGLFGPTYLVQINPSTHTMAVRVLETEDLAISALLFDGITIGIAYNDGKQFGSIAWTKTDNV